MTLPAAAVLVFLAVSASAQELVPRDPESSIIDLEHAWVDGEARNDNNALDQIFDNGLVYIEYGKLLSKAEYLMRVRVSGKHLPQQIEMQGMTVRRFGSAAIVVGVYQEKKLAEGRLTLRQWRFIDTWVFKYGRWKLVSAASAPIMGASVQK